MVKVKQSLYRLGKACKGCRRVRLPEFLDSRHLTVVRLAAQRSGRLYPPQETILLLISVRGSVVPKVIVWLEGLSQ
jgi:hypothetical protein